MRGGFTRSACGSRAAAPVRLAHLGLGAFFRAHQADYTDRASDAAEWGIAAFAGRGAAQLVDDLNAQAGLYTLVTCAPAADGYNLTASVSRAHHAADHDAWLACLRDPALVAVTTTVTEAGYLRAAGGGADLDHPELRGDLARLRADPAAAVRTAPARLVAGLDARRRAPTQGRSRSCPATTSSATVRRSHARRGRRGRALAGRPGGVDRRERVSFVQHERSTASRRARPRRTSPTSAAATGRDDALPRRDRTVQRVGARRTLPRGAPAPGRTRAPASSTT